MENQNKTFEKIFVSEKFENFEMAGLRAGRH